jgi:surfeit locus 1 family protein
MAPPSPSRASPPPGESARASLLPVTLATAAALAVLVSLGTWQLQRKAWKEALLATIAERAHAAPIPLAEAERRHAAGQSLEFTRVAVSGRFLHAHEIHVYAPVRPVPGYHIFTPMLTRDGTLVFINRGAVPEASKDPARRSAGQIAGETSLVGRLRLPEPKAWFTPENDEVRNVWHRRDPRERAEAIAAAGPGAENRPRDHGSGPRTGAGRIATVSFYLDAEALPANPGGWPRGGTTPTTLTNRHLEYAITWFGLALTLVGVYAAFVMVRRR